MDRVLIRRSLIATAMAALVVVGSRGGSVVASLRLGRPATTALVYVLVAAGTVGVAVAWVVVLLLRRRGSGEKRRDHPGARSWTVRPSRLLPGAVVAAALIGLLGISRLDLRVAHPTASAALPHQGGAQGRPLAFRDYRAGLRAGEGTGKEYSEPAAEDRPLQVGAALLVLLVGAALVWWWFGRRSRAAAARLAEEIDTEAARSTVLRSIEAMLADPDPKTAIIGAYARLLEGLADAGVPRWAYEGPVEHLRRALTRLRVRPGPIRRLVSLFEIARFSTRDLTMADRDEALAALHEVAADLGHAPAAVTRSSVLLFGRSEW